MSNMNIFWLTLAALVAGVILLLMNFSTYSPFKQFSKNSVSGMAVEHNGELYTLSYEQQTAMIDLINKSVSAKETPAQDPSIDVKKIVVYPLGNQKSFDLIPLTYTPEGNLLFTLQGKVRKDVSGGELKQLLSTTYDH